MSFGTLLTTPGLMPLLDRVYSSENHKVLVVATTDVSGGFPGFTPALR